MKKPGGSREPRAFFRVAQGDPIDQLLLLLRRRVGAAGFSAGT
jgi:hypothetical protein